MSLDFIVDLTGDTPESIEAGTQTPVGWYHCRLEDVYDDEKTAGMTVFKYAVLSGNAGAWNGKHIFDRIGDPDFAEAENAADTIRKRTKLLAKRLGLLTDDEIRAGGQVSRTWYDALNREFIVHVVGRIYEPKDKATGQKIGEKRPMTSVDFAGVYPLTYDVSKFPKTGPNAPPPDVLQLMAAARGGTSTGAVTGTTTAPAPAAPTQQGGAAPAAPATPATPAAPAFDFSDM